MSMVGKEAAWQASQLLCPPLPCHMPCGPCVTSLSEPREQHVLLEAILLQVLSLSNSDGFELVA